MAVLTNKIVHAKNKANGKGEIQIEHLLGEAQLDGKCDMFAKVTIGPGCSIGYHEHHGESETYYILEGQGLYSDNGQEVAVKAGDTMFCPSGEGHAIENTEASGNLSFMALIIKN